MTDRLIVGIGLAMIVESAHWVRIRWNFNDAAFSRAWHLSALSILTTVVVVWLEGNPYTAMPRLLGWLPPLLLPVQFTQSFGLRSSIPLNSFSFFAKQRKKRNLRLGLQESAVQFNFGNAYLVIAIISSTLGTNAQSSTFLPGILFLIGWAIFSQRRTQPAGLAIALSLCGLIAYGGQKGLHHASERMSGRYSRETENATSDPNTTRTSIGKLDKLKASNRILWRLKILDGHPAPALLRTAGYNRYNDGTWRNHIHPDSQSHDLDFQDLDVQGDASLDETYYLVRPNSDASAFRDELPRFRLRGSVTNRSLLPLPGNVASVRDFPLDGIERNALGTVRIFPQQPVIDGLVLWNDHLTPESPPWEVQDLHIPANERATLQEILPQTGLDRSRPVSEQIPLLRSWFHQNFSYRRYLTMPAPDHDRSRTALGRFLTEDRNGHCEYFATAAVLLFREMGIPARYAVGFSVAESDLTKAEYTLRGIHSHAWCRVWDESQGAWLDFDGTPPWLNADAPRESGWLADAFLKLREDFFLWRNETRNQIGVSIAISILSVIALAVIVRRLSRSRHIVQRGAESPAFISEIRTPLHQLEAPAARVLGPRPPGLPFSRWLAGLRPSLGDPTPLDEALTLHQRLRFDPLPPAASATRQLEELTRDLLASLKKSKNESPP